MMSTAACFLLAASVVNARVYYMTRSLLHSLGSYGSYGAYGFHPINTHTSAKAGPLGAYGGYSSVIGGMHDVTPEEPTHSPPTPTDPPSSTTAGKSEEGVPTDSDLASKLGHTEGGTVDGVIVDENIEPKDEDSSDADAGPTLTETDISATDDAKLIGTENNKGSLDGAEDQISGGNGAGPKAGMALAGAGVVGVVASGYVYRKRQLAALNAAEVEAEEGDDTD